MLRSHISAVAIAAVAISLFAVNPATAQDTPCAPVGGPMISPDPSGNPFTAVVKITADQKLPDGNIIHAVAHYRIARDSAGRALNEMPMGCYTGEDGQLHTRYGVNINDRSAGTTTHWNTGDDAMKIVNISHTDTAQTRAAQSTMPKLKPSITNRYNQETSVEQLGTRDISGILATGTKRIRIIPPGEEGNAQPLEVVNEIWTSSDTKSAVMSISDDPRRGRTVAEIEEFHPGDPDAALFTPPADYAIMEQKIEVTGRAPATATNQAH